MSRLVAVTGSRAYGDGPFVWKTLDEQLQPEDVLLVGDASGLDAAAYKWAIERFRSVTQFEADWSYYGRAAGPIRNAEMLAAADMLLAFMDGAGPGTKNCIAQATRKGIPVTEVWR